MNRERAVSIVVATRDRPALLERALASAQAQEGITAEVIVVDDGSKPPVRIAEKDALRTLRVDPARGVSHARNLGLRAARGRWVAFLDDDDELVPGALAAALEAIAASTLPEPVAALAAIEVIGSGGGVTAIRVPPPELPRGCLFHLEDIGEGYSFLTKQTLVVEREVLLGLGGFDEAFRSRGSTDLFLRLNPVCSLVGVPRVGYRLSRDDAPRLSRDPILRRRSFVQLVRKHWKPLLTRPRGAARMLRAHAVTSRRDGLPFDAALWSFAAKLARAAGVLLPHPPGGTSSPKDGRGREHRRNRPAGLRRQRR